MIPMRLDGKLAMVTGAGGGIGSVTSLDLADLGADVVLHYRTSAGRCEEVKREIEAKGRRAFVVKGDISNPDDCRRMVAEACEHFGRPIDLLINNAAFFYDTVALIDMTDAQVGKTIDINLKGTMYMSREVCKRLVDAGLPGRVINISSGAGHSGRANFCNYCASKAGVLNLTRAMAIELAPHGINVNSVTVGYVEVGLWDDQKDVSNDILPRILLRRPGKPEDISRMVCFLAGECGNWITGNDFRIDGGESAGRIPYTMEGWSDN